MPEAWLTLHSSPAVSTSVFESLFNLYLSIGVAAAILVTAFLVYLALRYRERPGSPEPQDAPSLSDIGKDLPERGRPLYMWSLVASIALVLFAISLGTMETASFLEKPSEGTLLINVEGFQWGWKFTYPHGFSTIGELVVPIEEVVLLNVTSSDVFHSLDIPKFKIKVDAIPGQHNLLWFKASSTGEFRIQCVELCGLGHTIMVAKLVVMEREGFEAWLKSKQGGAT